MTPTPRQDAALTPAFDTGTLGYRNQITALEAHNRRMSEALRRVDHTLSVHGHIDAETELHAYVRAAIIGKGSVND